MKQNTINKSVVCVIGSIHGDEAIGKRIVEKIASFDIEKGKIITAIGNSEALKKRKRFIDADLNRCFPGKRNGNHEERIAFRLSKILKKADFVIDVHSTSTDVKDLVIIKKRNKKILKLLKFINPKMVAIMPKGIGDKSLINHCRVGVSFEYGPHKSMYTYRRCLQDINRVLFRLGMVRRDTKRKNFKTAYFQVCGTVKKPKGIKMRKNIRNFVLVQKGDILGRVKNSPIFAEENFYPILFGEKAYKDIMGFKAKKMAG